MPAADAIALSPPAGSRVAVVGAAGGIGRCLVERLLAAGCQVAALDLPASLERHPVPEGVIAHALDATDEGAVEDAFSAVHDAFGALDGLVNLVGFTRERVPVSETPLGTWEEVVEGNLSSTFLACRAALPLLHQGRNAAIVNTSSGLAMKPTPGYGPYSVAKAGVLALTRLLAQENAPRVRANAVAPSAVDTAFLRGGTGRGGDDASATRLDVEAYLRTIPLGRIADADDVVGPILFLLGPASAYVTGHTLHVNGGLLMT
ncbi:SDR family NAD(P)-dependent oxidoreductase [Salinarimonas soli]|uniref:SDR family oxidoreductase n=1 Tax=Salinarimonas soli TaxID=1638099 RepID=A0A5B2VAJ5_9HYPH|nr:SDR family NAD(P)-dependent oxidoreductase [Salinarimonas soli]KAA2235217.1 SDR family oxidoreductase [Salinarimonas soli]